MQASGSWDKTVRLWNPRNGKLIHVLEGHDGWVQAVTFSPDGIYVASACDDDSVRVWDIVTGTCIKLLEVSTHKPPYNTSLIQHSLKIGPKIGLYTKMIDHFSV